MAKKIIQSINYYSRRIIRPLAFTKLLAYNVRRFEGSLEFNLSPRLAHTDKD